MKAIYPAFLIVVITSTWLPILAAANFFDNAHEVLSSTTAEITHIPVMERF
jgi:hypothetical protein